MAQGVDVEKLRSVLECLICLDQFTNPKTLKCNHEFCKTCIEGVMEFQNDGSAKIQCPLRCNVETIVDKYETVNDLGTSYTTKNVLDLLSGMNISDGNGETHHRPLCGENSCENLATLFCCEKIMCSSCHSCHLSGDVNQSNHRKMLLSFNGGDGKLRALCAEHDSPCTHICTCDGRHNDLMCSYCVHRSSPHYHPSKTIEEKACSLREGLNDLTTGIEKIKVIQTLTHEYAASTKIKLQEVLQQRKRDALKNFSDFLDKEEERILKKFQESCESSLTDIDTAMINATEIETLLQKSDIELYVTRYDIFENVMSKKVEEIRLLTVELSQNGSDYNKPLGDIQTLRTENVGTEQKEMPTSTFMLVYIRKDRLEVPFQYLMLDELEGFSSAATLEPKCNRREENDEEVVPKRVVEEQDIDIVCQQACVSRSDAVDALTRTNGDIINAILDLVWTADQNSEDPITSMDFMNPGNNHPTNSDESTNPKQLSKSQRKRMARKKKNQEKK